MLSELAPELGHGRPLSMIDSVSSDASSDEERESPEVADDSDIRVEGTSGRVTPPASPLPPAQEAPEPSSKTIDRLKSQIRDLFSTWATEAYGSPDQVLARDLPDLLSAYELKRGKPLISDDGLPGLRGFVEAHPETELNLDQFVALVAKLQQTWLPPGEEADTSASSSGADTSTSTDEDDSQVYSSDEEAAPNSPSPRRTLQPRSSSPAPGKGSGTTTPLLARSPREAAIDMPNTPRSDAVDAKAQRPKPQPFPSSKSAHFEGENGAHAGEASDEDGPRLPSELQNKRHFTTSDPADSPHRRASAPVPRSKQRTRERRASDRRVSDEGGEEKAVLSGKGRAKVPPSSWQRPKPQGLAARARRTSDASACSAEGSADGSNGTPSGSSRPSHHRMQSMPVGAMASGSSPPLGVSRSASGYSFPRTSQERPEVSTDEWAADQQERYDASRRDEAGDTTELPRGSSSRGASPGVVSDENGYQRFGAMSASLDGGFSSRPSSAAGRRVSMTGGYGMHPQDSSDQLELNDTLRAKLAEMERKYRVDTTRQYETIAGYENDMEAARVNMTQQRKDLQESKAREARANERIATAEAELSLKVMALSGSDARCETLSQQCAEYHAVITSQRKTIAEQERQLAEYKRDEQVNAEHTAAWDAERERWRAQISAKTKEIEELHQKLIEVEDLRIELQRLRMQNETLSQDLTDARRQANEPRSTPTTLTRGSGMAIGHELRQVVRPDLRQAFMSPMPLEETAEQSSEEETASEIEEANISVGRAFGVPAPEDAEEEADESVSTEGEAEVEVEEEEEQQRTPTLPGDQSQMSNSTASEADSSPPTYDEASLELRIASRLHPTHASSVSSSGETATAEVHAALSSKHPEESAYLLLRNELGIRCTAIEDLIEKHRREHPKVVATAAASVVPAEDEEADSSSSSASSESTTVPNDDVKRFARLRNLRREASERAASLLEQAAQFVQHDVLQAALHSGAATAAFYGSHKVLIWSMLIFVVGATIGAHVFPEPYPFDSPTVVLESGKEWNVIQAFQQTRQPWSTPDAQVSKTWLERIVGGVASSKQKVETYNYVPT